MKKAGDILSSLFDESFVKKAHGYSNLFNSWADIACKNGIAAAAAHSRIKELEKGILLIEMDHPGWKQILQTKQSKLLNDFRIRFPELNISAISLMLGSPDCGKPQTDTQAKMEAEKPPYPAESLVNKPADIDYEAVENVELREKLKKLGQVISAREKT